MLSKNIEYNDNSNSLFVAVGTVTLHPVFIQKCLTEPCYKYLEWNKQQNTDVFVDRAVASDIVFLPAWRDSPKILWKYLPIIGGNTAKKFRSLDYLFSKKFLEIWDR